MVLALLAGTKTQTRRNFKPQPSSGRCPVGWGSAEAADPSLLATPFRVRCPYGKPGDRLWGRETWRIVSNAEAEIEYRADKSTRRCLESPDSYWEGKRGVDLTWRPSIFMPRWASRITLEVTGVRVERLQDISETDARAEGITPLKGNGPNRWTVDWEHGSLNAPTAREVYLMLWDAINGDGSADKNPWLWCIEFKRVAP